MGIGHVFYFDLKIKESFRNAQSSCSRWEV